MIGKRAVGVVLALAMVAGPVTSMASVAETPFGPETAEEAADSEDVEPPEKSRCGLIDPRVPDGENPQTGCLDWKHNHDPEPEEKSYSSAFGPDDRVAVGPDGERVYVTADSSIPGDTASISVSALDASSGTEVWTDSYKPRGDHETPWTWMKGIDVVVDPSTDRVFHLGLAKHTDANWEPSPQLDTLVVRAYEGASGQVLWSHSEEFVSPNLDRLNQGHGLHYAAGSLFVGYQPATEGGGPMDVGLFALDATTGSPTWSTTFDGPGSGWDKLGDVAVGPDGERLYLATTITTNRTPVPDRGKVVAPWILVADAGTGEMLKTDEITDLSLKVPDPPHPLWTGFAKEVELSSDGGQLLVGTAAFPHVVDGYDPSSLDRSWRTPHDSLNRMTDLLAGGGSVYVAGATDFQSTTTAWDYYTSAVTVATGEKEWVSSWDGKRGCADMATHLSLSPEGETVHVVGDSMRPPAGHGDFSCRGGIFDKCHGYHCAFMLSVTRVGTVALDAAAGDVLWEAVYDTGVDKPVWPSVAVNPDSGQVHVGAVETGASDMDILTLTYPPKVGLNPAPSHPGGAV